MKKLLYPILAVVVFLGMQTVGGIIMVGMVFIKNPDVFKHLAKTRDPNILLNYIMTGDSLAWTLILTDIASVIILAAMHMIKWKTVFDVKSINWKLGLLAIVGALLGIVYTDILSEFMKLPDEMGDIFSGLATSVVGALSIGVIGPIVEEFIFREALLGFMLRNDWNKWVAITTSALVFGIIHGNLAQIPFAVVVGFIFGLIYYKTGNIVITSILHIINNSFAVWLMYSMGEKAKDASLTEWLGGSAISIGIGIVVGILSFVLLKQFWKKSQAPYWCEQPKLIGQTEEVVESKQPIIETNLNTQENETIL